MALADPQVPTFARLVESLGVDVAGWRRLLAAIDEGHRVTVFLAGDAAQLIRDAVLDQLTGLGTGRLREHFDALCAAGVRLHVSGLSAKAHGVTDADLAGKPAEFAPPQVLVRLSLEHDRMFTY